MSESSFRLQLAEPAAGKYTPLSFSYCVGNGDGLTDPVTGAFGSEIDYGKLFAYCFRRFGYPNRGWDNHKELGRYLLTTPRDDLILSVVPHVGNRPALTFSFLAPSEVGRAADAYLGRARRAWQERALTWQEQQGLPDWMDEWRTYYNEVLSEKLGIKQATSWRDALVAFPFGETGSQMREMTDRMAQFHDQLLEDYRKVEPEPDLYLRPADVSDWPDDDPLKPYAEAAVTALKDLYRPVQVRDQVINAFGLVDTHEWEYESLAKEAPVAGYPSGDLGNRAPAEFAELHSLILKIGEGDAKAGIERAMEALKASAAT